MDRLELIQVRTYGEKLNELSSLVYDHFGQMFRCAKWHLLALSAALTAIMYYMPDYNQAETMFKSLCVIVVMMVPVVAVISVMGEENVCWKDGRFSLWNRRFGQQLGLSLITILIPSLLYCLLADWLSDQEVSSGWELGYLFLRFFKLVVIMLLCVPLFQLNNIACMEHRTGIEAMSRMWKILRTSFWGWFFFLGTVAFIGLMLPTLSKIPAYIITMVGTDIIDGYTIEAEPSMWRYVITFIFSWFFCIFVTLFVMLFALATLLEYGNAVERIDNVHFMEKYNNFDNL